MAGIANRLDTLWRTFLVWVAVGLLVSGLLTWGINAALDVGEPLRLFIALSLACLLLALGWLSLRVETPPNWLAWVLVGAVLIRLGAGVFWAVALPVWGYGSEVEQQGYVMADAHERDRAAWDLAQSGKPLTRAYAGGYRKADQYGGMLVISAAYYRLLGGNEHQPILLVILMAVFSALGVLYTWAFTRHTFGARAAVFAAWGLALYPEAVLLGSSQMREAFLVTLAVGAFYGLVRFLDERVWTGITWVFGALLLCGFLSPPFAALLIAMLALQVGFHTQFWRRRKVFASPWLWLGLVGIVALALASLWLSQRELAPAGIRGPWAFFVWWVNKSAAWQAHLSKRASGWVQKIFSGTPEWSHLPMLLVYGVAQPFLPAAIGDTSGALIWRGIAIWRGLGWTGLLLLTVYSTYYAWREQKNPWGRGLSIVIWFSILAAAYRGGADLWDNPRYRVAFAGLQVALAAWGWVKRQGSGSRVWQRVLVGGSLAMVWFMPWYLRRYIHLAWPVSSFLKTVGLALITLILYSLLEWISSAQREKPGSDPSD